MAEKIKVYLRRMRINRGGYDDSGQYWGIGAPLYCALFEADGTGYIDETIRAHSRDDAKDIIRRKFALKYPQYEAHFWFAR